MFQIVEKFLKMNETRFVNFMRFEFEIKKVNRQPRSRVDYSIYIPYISVMNTITTGNVSAGRLASNNAR